VLHELKNQVRRLSDATASPSVKEIREWARDLAELLTLAMEVCRRDETQGIGALGELKSLQCRLSPYQEIVSSIARDGCPPGDGRLAVIWQFLQEEETKRGPLFRSVQAEVVGARGGGDDQSAEHPALLAMVKVLSVVLPLPVCTPDGEVAVGPDEDGSVAVLWSYENCVVPTGILLPTAVMSPTLRRSLESIRASTVLDAAKR
jgi:hypothetical protein